MKVVTSSPDYYNGSLENQPLLAEEGSGVQANYKQPSKKEGSKWVAS